jgi:hypothetical protein
MPENNADDAVAVGEDAGVGKNLPSKANWTALKDWPLELATGGSAVLQLLYRFYWYRFERTLLMPAMQLVHSLRILIYLQERRRSVGRPYARPTPWGLVLVGS